MKSLFILFVVTISFIGVSLKCHGFTSVKSNPGISKDSAQKLLESVIYDDPWNENTRATIKTAISAGANPNTTYGSVFFTLLIGAVDNENTDLVQFLLINGAQINRRDADEFTALHQAVYKGNEEIVTILLKNGAEVNAKDNLGRTPWDLTDSEKIHAILKAKGGKPGQE
jgi:ankyrin repeat protein